MKTYNVSVLCRENLVKSTQPVQHQIDLVVGQASAELDLTLSQVCHPRKKQELGEHLRAACCYV